MNKRILLAEDEPALRESLQDLLQTIGFVVKSCENGRACMQVIPIFRPHLIISDIMMPELDGIGLLTQIKSNHDFNDIPVILLTAKSEKEDRLTGLYTGADQYLTKPFDVEELKLVISNLLSLRDNIVKYSVQHSKELNEVSESVTFLENLTALLECHAAESHPLAFYASEMKLSPSGFKKKLKKESGKSFSEYIRAFRLEKARHLLRKQDNNISEVAYQTGFKSLSHFSDSFKKHYGLNPKTILVNG